MQNHFLRLFMNPSKCFRYFCSRKSPSSVKYSRQLKDFFLFTSFVSDSISSKMYSILATVSLKAQMCLMPSTMYSPTLEPSLELMSPSREYSVLAPKKKRTEKMRKQKLAGHTHGPKWERYALIAMRTPRMHLRQNLKLTGEQSLFRYQLVDQTKMERTSHSSNRLCSFLGFSFYLVRLLLALDILININYTLLFRYQSSIQIVQFIISPSLGTGLPPGTSLSESALLYFFCTSGLFHKCYEWLLPQRRLQISRTSHRCSNC